MATFLLIYNYNPYVILFNNRFAINTFHNAGKNMRSYIQYKGYCNGWYRTNDESFLSSSQIMEVENDGQKLVVRYYKFIYIGCSGFNIRMQYPNPSSAGSNFLLL